MTRSPLLRWWWFVVAAVVLWQAMPRAVALEIPGDARFRGELKGSVYATVDNMVGKVECRSDVIISITRPSPDKTTVRFASNGQFKLTGAEGYFYSVSSQAVEAEWRDEHGDWVPAAGVSPGVWVSGTFGSGTWTSQAPVISEYSFYNYSFTHTALRMRLSMSGLNPTAWVEFVIGEKEGYRAKLLLKNPTDFPITYRVMQNGEVVETVVVPPRSVGTHYVTTDSPDPVTVFAQVGGLTMDGGSWVEQEGAVLEMGAIGDAVTPTKLPDEPPETQLPDVNLPSSSGSSGSTGTSETGKLIWKHVTANNDPTQQKDLVTGATYREGVDKITTALAKVEKAASKQAGGVTVDLTGVHSRLDAIKAAVEKIETKEQREAKEAAAKTQAEESTEQGKLQGAEAAAVEKAILASKGGGLASPPSIGGGGDYASILQLHFPAAFGGATINCNPFSHSGLRTVAHWFRDAVAWLAFVMLGVYVWKDMGEWVRGFSTMRQAQGNAVAAGSGAQATALVAAGLITAAVVVAMTALMSWTFGEISFAALRSVAGSNPVASMPSAALGMLSEVLPVATLVGCALAKYSFRFYGASLFAGCAAVVCFVVP